MARLSISFILIAALAACGGGDGSSGAQGVILASRGVIVEIQGDKQTELLKLAVDAFALDPALSSDGKANAFSYQAPFIAGQSPPNGFGLDLYTLRFGEKEAKPLIVHAVPGEYIRTPNWLPGDAQILYEVRGRDAGGLQEFRIETIDIASGKRSVLFRGGVEPALSPDGKTLAYVRIDETQRERITLYDMATAQQRTLLPNDNTKTLITSVVWSPDGTQIAFAAADATAAYLPGLLAHPTLQDIWVVKTDGSGLKRLSDLAESDPGIAWADNATLYVFAFEELTSFDVATGQQRKLRAGPVSASITVRRQ